jgi:hypothetical protein
MEEYKFFKQKHKKMLKNEIKIYKKSTKKKPYKKVKLKNN